MLRCPPAIVKVAQDALAKRLDPKAFPFLGEEQEVAQKAGVTWHKDSEEEESRVIIAMVGGLSHFEVCSLQNLERSEGTQRLVIGSTAIVTAHDFIESVCP